MTEIMKKCAGCGMEMTADMIINDPTIRPIGMSFMDVESDAAYYFFQHEIKNCGSCFVINVEKFTALIEELIPAKILAMTATCKKYCSDIQSLQECGYNCHYSPYRRFLLHMLKVKFPERVTE